MKGKASSQSDAFLIKGLTHSPSLFSLDDDIIDFCHHTLTSEQPGLGVTPSPAEGATPAAMSIQEGPQRAPSPVLIKPESKPRPEVPPKPSLQSSTSPPPDHCDGVTAPSEGKVKSIVSKFSRQEQSERTEQPADELVEVISSKRFKRPPVVKPKPRRASLPMQLEGQQAPPLPMKRSRRLKVLVEDAVSVECGRSGEPAFTIQHLVAH